MGDICSKVSKEESQNASQNPSIDKNIKTKSKPAAYSNETDETPSLVEAKRPLGNPYGNTNTEYVFQEIKTYGGNDLNNNHVNIIKKTYVNNNMDFANNNINDPFSNFNFSHNDFNNFPNMDKFNNINFNQFENNNNTNVYGHTYNNEPLGNFKIIENENISGFKGEKFEDPNYNTANYSRNNNTSINNNNFYNRFDNGKSKNFNEFEDMTNSHEAKVDDAFLNEFRKESLMVHNQYRKKHRVSDLVSNQELDLISQRYAQKIASSGNFKHSDCMFKNDHMGENIYMQMGRKMTGKLAVDSWYSEIKNCNFNDPESCSGVGHFTQLVWKDSKQLGIGCAKSSDGAYYVVANYYPAGNWGGEYKRNVFSAQN